MLKPGETREWKGSGFMGTLYFLLIFLKKQNLLKKKKKRAAWAGPRFWGVDTSNTGAPRTVEPTEKPPWALEVGSGLHTRGLWGQAPLIPDPMAPPPWEEVASTGPCGE